MLLQDGTHGDVDLVVGHGFIPEHFPHAVHNESQKLTPSVHADLAILNRLHQHSIGLHLKKKKMQISFILAIYSHFENMIFQHTV